MKSAQLIALRLHGDPGDPVSAGFHPASLCKRRTEEPAGGGDLVPALNRPSRLTGRVSANAAPGGLKRTGEWLRILSRETLLALEDERKRISRELHDEVGQALTAVNLSLVILGKQLRGDSALGDQVRTAQRLVEQTLKTVHRFACSLRPEILDQLGAAAAIRSQARAFSERTGIPAVIEPEANLAGLDRQQEAALFRVVQESLTNVARHARASAVRIEIRRRAQGIELRIHDNGRAFAASHHSPHDRRKRLGLLGMAERVRLAHGEFSIDSAPGRGTTVRAYLAFKAARTAHRPAIALLPQSAA